MLLLFKNKSPPGFRRAFVYVRVTPADVRNLDVKRPTFPTGWTVYA